MKDVQLGDLIVRMLISLVVVLALILIAYAVIKRRRNGPSMGSARRPRLRTLAAAIGGGRQARPGNGNGNGSPRRPARPGGNKRGLQTLGRIGLSRTSSVVAVQFAKRVYLLGTSETGTPNVLADVDVDAWMEALEDPDDPAGPAGPGGKGVVGIPIEGEGRPKLLDALREATTRRG